MIVRLKDQKGYPILLNTEHVVAVSHCEMKPQSGGPPQIAVGMCAVVMVGGATFVLGETIETVYGALLRRPSDAQMQVMR